MPLLSRNVLNPDYLIRQESNLLNLCIKPGMLSYIWKHRKQARG